MRHATTRKKLGKGIEGMKIAFSPALGYVEVDAEVAKAVKKAVKVLEDLGAEVDQVDPGFADPAPCFRVLWWSGARALLGKLPDEKKALLDPGLRRCGGAVAWRSRRRIISRRCAQRGALGSQMRVFMERYDLLVTPTLPIAAFGAGLLSPADEGQGKWVDWTPFSYPFNLTQQPAASVPCGFTKAGLPIGLHLVGKMFDDRTVLRASKAYEDATEWGKRRPKIG